MKIIGIIILVLVGIIVLAIAVLGVLRFVDDSRMNRIRSSLKVSGDSEKVFSPEIIEGLPELAQRYLLHAIKPGTPLARRVELKMSGMLKPKEDAPWMPLQATQILTPGHGFIWKAKAKAAGPIFMNVTDHYANGEGRMRVALFGLLPMVNASNPDIARSGAGRLMGECVWLPAAFLPQNGAVWQEMDSLHAKVTLSIDDLSAALSLTIDEKGRLKELVLPRWKDDVKEFVPFGVVIEEEREFDGFTIPSQLHGGWWYGSKQYAEFFHFTIEQAMFY
ncbi:MAG: hypothetical protein JRI72_11380 [Deltaproteobacteria bacterium]|nr:hypothetical protein [Deltaproteobacteria bacterium]